MNILGKACKLNKVNGKVLDEKGNECYALFDPVKFQIRHEPNTKPSIILHECFHAIVSHLGIELDSNLEEVLARAIEYVAEENFEIRIRKKKRQLR